MSKSQYSWIHHICWGVLLNHDPHHTWIAIMTDYAAYFDDSGHPDDQPYVVIAGFLSTEDKWKDFERVWSAALTRHELGEYFHMADFENSKRPKKKKKQILEDLTKIISDHTDASFSAAIEMDAYRKINDVYALEEALGKPFAIVARSVAIGINSWKQQFFNSANDKLLVFIEEGTKHYGDMVETYRRDALPVPQLVPKRHPSAQAADMLAWEVFHYVQHDDDRRSLVNLLRNKLIAGNESAGIFRENSLIKTCALCNVPLRSELGTNPEIVFHSSPKRKRTRTIK